MCFFFFKQKTAYEMRISDWSSDVCSSDLEGDQVEARLRYDIRHDNGVDVLRLDLLQAHELRQPDCIFVGGPLRVAGATPRTAQRVAFVDGENHVRISRIDGKQHDTPYDVTGR